MGYLLPCILVTAPVFHLDTSWLNLRAWWNTGREGATKRRKNHNQQKRYRLETTNTKRRKRVRIVIRWNSSCRTFKIDNSGRRGHREGERVHLLRSIVVTAPVFHLDTSWLNLNALTNTAREGATKKRKTNPPQSTKKVPFQTHNIKKNKTCEKCDPMKLELSFIQNTQQRNAWPQRGRESTLTPIHIFHRPSIPFWHVLIERRCFIKHCKEQWVNKKKEKTNPPPQTTQKGIGSKTQNNNTCENCDSIKLELSYIQNTQQRKAWPQR